LLASEHVSCGHDHLIASGDDYGASRPVCYSAKPITRSHGTEQPGTSAVVVAVNSPKVGPGNRVTAVTGTV
jgi:hypothetical protein